jgi:O-antigen/teichoic acid export membrane protein
VSAEAATPTIRRNAVFAALAEASRALFAATLALVATRILGPDEYGLFALALGVAALALLPSDFGVSAAAGRYIAERRAEGSAVAAVVADALRLKLVFAGGASILLAVLADPIAGAYGEPGLEAPLRATAVALFAQSVFALFVSVFVSMGRTSLQALLFTGESLAEVVLVVGAIAIGGTAGAAAGGRAAAFGLGALLGLVVAVRLIGPGIRPRLRAIGPGRKLAGYASVLFFVDAAYILFATLDILLIGAYLGSEAVGLFEPALRLTTLVAMAGTAIASAVAPRIARGASEGPATEALVLGMRLLIVVGAGAAAVCLVWAEPVIRLLFGSDYAESATVLRTFAPYMLLVVTAPLVTMSVNYAGLGRKRIPAVLVALVVNLVLDVVLIPRIGIEAGAIATTVAYAIYLPAHVWFLHRALGLDLARLGRTVVRALLAALVLGGILAAAGTGDVGAGALAAGAVLGGLAFGATLLATREITIGELRALAAARR